MQHKISEFCDKIKVMCIKAEQLRSMKYDTPKEKRNENEIKFLIEDIQALAREIHSDKQIHPKMQKDQ